MSVNLDESSATDISLAQLSSHEDSRRAEDDSSQRTAASESEELTALPEPEYPAGFKFYAAALAQCLMLVLIGFDNTVVSTAVPAITNQFHSLNDVGWYSVAYRLSLCATQFLFSKLYKSFPLKIVLLSSVAILQIGSVLCATATTSAMFVLGRAVAGLGSAGMLSGCFNLSLRMLPLNKRPLYTSIIAAVESASEMAAPILGGVLTQKLNWRWCFYVTLPIGAASWIIMALFLSVPEVERAEDMSWRAKLAQLDLPGTLILLPCLTCLFIALTWAGFKYAWSSPIIITLFVLFVIFLIGFTYSQYRMSDRATLPPQIVRQRSVMCGFLFSSCCAGSLQIFNYYLPIYFQAVHQYTPAQSGLMMLPTAICFLLGMLVQGSGTNIVGFCNPFMLVCSTLMPISVGLMTTFKVSSPLVELLSLSGFAGFACGVGYQAPQVAVQTTLSSIDAPMALAVIIFAQHFGPALWVAIAQTVFTDRLAANLQQVGNSTLISSIEDIGLTDLQKGLSSDQLGAVLQGFDQSLVQTFYLAVALTSLTMAGSLAMPWKSVKEKRS